jgi:hypothetical protein
MHELEPRGHWWSKPMLLRGKRNWDAPAGVVRGGDKEYAVEIEPAPRDRTELIAKYKRRYAEHRSERRGVVVLCLAEQVELFEELKRECEWTNLYVEACPAFDKDAMQPLGPAPLIEVDPDSLPQGLLLEIHKREGLKSPPHVKLAGRRKALGFPRWRITTEWNVWCATETPLGWWAKPADDRERNERLLSPAKPVGEQRREPELQATTSPEEPRPAKRVEPAHWKRSKVLPASLPHEGLDAVFAAAGVSSSPDVLSIVRHPNADRPRWRVEFGGEVWWVAQDPAGCWTATPADPSTQPRRTGGTGQARQANEAEQQPSDELGHERLPNPSGAEESKSPSSPPSRRHPIGSMRDIPVSEVPPEVIGAIQWAAKSETPPTVLFASKRRGSGAPRWRIGTTIGIWRVTYSSYGWLARPSE